MKSHYSSTATDLVHCNNIIRFCSTRNFRLTTSHARPHEADPEPGPGGRERFRRKHNTSFTVEWREEAGEDEEGGKWPARCWVPPAHT